VVSLVPSLTLCTLPVFSCRISDKRRRSLRIPQSPGNIADQELIDVFLAAVLAATNSQTPNFPLIVASPSPGTATVPVSYRISWIFIDSDGDGIADRDEIPLGLDPFDPDTDGDGVTDGDENAFGSDPADPGDTPEDGDTTPEGEAFEDRYQRARIKLEGGTSSLAGTSYTPSGNWFSPVPLARILPLLTGPTAPDHPIRLFRRGVRYEYILGNGLSPEILGPSNRDDFSFLPEADDWTQTASLQDGRLWAPLHCKDYAAAARVRITLKKNGEPVGNAALVSVPHDANGDQLADRWQNREITAWNTQFAASRPVTEAERNAMQPNGEGVYPDTEEADSDGAGNGDGGRNLPAIRVGMTSDQYLDANFRRILSRTSRCRALRR